MHKISSQQSTLHSFSALSMKILRLANRGVSREEFLRDVLKTIQRFSRAHEVWLVYAPEDHRTTWRFSAGTEDDELVAERQPPQRGDLVEALLKEEYTSSDPAFAGRPVYWRRNISSSTSVPNSDASAEARSLETPWRDAVSSIAVPVPTEGRNQAVLALTSRAPDAFAQQAVEFVEGLAQTLGAAMADRAAQAALRERVKELGCLYEISQMAQRPDIEIEEVLDRTVDILPPAFQYPELAAARICLDDRIYATASLRDTDLKLTSPIVVDGTARGSVEVRYNAAAEEFTDRAFLDEEQKLLDGVAQQIALIVEGKQAEQERRELEVQLRHADRLATIGELAAGVAHEINEPLGNILGFAQLMEKDNSLSNQSLHDCRRIVDASMHAREIVRKLLIFARQVQTQKGAVDLNRIVEDSLYFLESRCRRHGIELTRRLDRNLSAITADEGQINQVLVNLVVNAIQAVSEGGAITVTTISEPEHAALVVEDTGPGLDQSTRERIFVPFFTTKGPGEGTGLGLSVVHGIVTTHGGTIHAENREEGGARFIAEFPFSPEAHA